MPQIWLTYDELGDFLGISSDAAADRVTVEGWSRRRSRDGMTRVKLPERSAYDFMVRTVEDARRSVGAWRRDLGTPRAFS